MAQWFYAKGGQQAGPVSFEEIQRLASAGQLAGSDMVWAEGMANWQPAGTVPDLMPRAAAAAAGAPSSAPVFSAPTVSISEAPAAQSQQAAYPNASYDSAPAAAGPYAQPGYAPLSYASPGQGVVMVSERGLELLRQTRPWARFISIMMLIGGALYAVFGVIGLVGTLAASSRGTSFLAGQMIGAALVAIVYIALGTYLGKFATKIGQVVNARRSEDLDAALDAQRSFWRLSGILMAIGLGIVVVVLLLVVLRLARL